MSFQLVMLPGVVLIFGLLTICFELLDTPSLAQPRCVQGVFFFFFGVLYCLGGSAWGLVFFLAAFCIGMRLVFHKVIKNRI